MPALAPGSTVAAVDLGSNSFHAVVARLEGGTQMRVLDRLRERVALAEGLDAKGRLAAEVQDRAIACLERFGQVLRPMPRGAVRAVGTSSLRRARGAGKFLRRAEAALGHPVEVISGREEARLIYLGVSHDLSANGGRRLVVDIGGGSTEIILGEGPRILMADSLAMGCVSFSMKHFPEGQVTRERMKKAMIAAHMELETMERRYRKAGWATCVGSSGTIMAVQEVLLAGDPARTTVTPRALRRLRKALVAAGSVERLAPSGLRPDRAPVFAGGLAILLAIFERLEIASMGVAGGALREGLLIDLLGRIRHEDVREATIRAFAERHAVDGEQAARVEATALAFLRQVAAEWALEGEENERALAWAATLHEVGMSVAYSGYHKHGAYLVQNSDMAGFSREDQQIVAALIRSHRRRLSSESFEELPEARAHDALRLTILLRLAVRLHRSRSPRALPAMRVRVSGSSLSLAFPDGWLDAHPLTRAELEEESAYLEEVETRLSIA
jgi:exopolyphosphatase/guanosine-5'-triphosphate,3'-diphosphate pyrophosphatase